jgi:hypothetical protein
MACITSRRRTPVYLPTPEEIEELKAELDAKRLAEFDEGQPTPKAVRSRPSKVEATPKADAALKSNWGFKIANELLREGDVVVPQDLPVPDSYFTLNHDFTPSITVCGKVPVPEGGPREMSATDRRGFSIASFVELNKGLDKVYRQERWELTGVEPELAPKPTSKSRKRAKVTRDIVPFRARR